MIGHKVKQWRTTSSPEARVAYLHMFTQNHFADRTKRPKTPFLVIVGDHDAKGYSETVMKKTFLKWYPKAELMTLTCQKLTRCLHFTQE